MKLLKSLFLKYKELILYVFFGGLTTLVNWAGYWLLADVFHVPYLWATAIAQVLSILFAYVTNRIWVFESKAKGFSAVFWEMVRFFGCRAASFVLDLLCMRIGVGGASYQRHGDEAAFQRDCGNCQLCVQQADCLSQAQAGTLTNAFVCGIIKSIYVKLGGHAHGAQRSLRIAGV